MLTKTPHAMLTAGLLLLAACSGSAPPPEPVRDPAAIRKEYVGLTQRARAEVRAWSAAADGTPDPRPVWAKKLVDFATAHPGAPEAAEAFSGVMQMRAAMLDHEGFFKDYELMLRTCPDAPAVAATFSHVSTMRMAEAGGREALQTTDHAIKGRAWRRAVHGIVADMQRAIAATSNPSTIAAAQYTIGLTWYQMDVDLPRALEHFKIVAENHPSWSHAESAREYIRELETLGAGNAAPGFEAVTIDGRKVSLASLKGKIVLVDFWATWCAPCLTELPNLKRAHERYRSKGFTIIGVSTDTDKAALSRFVKKERIGWPIIIADAGGQGPADPIFRAYSVQSIPMSYLVDRTGTIRGRALFGAEVERAVGELIEK